ncbi:MAG: hypothetical protein JNL11_11465 [Bdellovibrionaceae bacterium]|nr:hypothetical protein [Pseudobdellovibrionaceae bacterium]
MKNKFYQYVGMAALTVACLQTACSQNGDAGEAAVNAGNTQTIESTTPSFLAKLKQDMSAETNSVLWETKTTVSAKRQIEVGDHPGIVLETFKMGQREQKVRFFVADDQKSIDLVSNSPQDLLLKKDVEISKSENTKWSLFGMVVQAPATLGLQKFSDSSMFNGLAVSPQLMMCAAEGLKNLKLASDKVPRVFQNWQLDTVNVFVKPVQHSGDAESKMAIDPKLKALNFQLSVWTRSGDCFLPSAEEIQEALSIADQRIHE